MIQMTTWYLGETGHHGTRNKSRSQRKIKPLRRYLKNTWKRFKVANELEKTALSGLMKVARKSRRTFEERSAPWKAKRAAEAYGILKANPFRTVTKLLGDKCSGTLMKSKGEIEEYIRQTHSDPQKGAPLDDNAKLLNPPLPASKFNYAKSTTRETIYILRKARVGSAQGPNGVHYKVYKSFLSCNTDYGNS